jgi:replicative DNA helicase
MANDNHINEACLLGAVMRDDSRYEMVRDLVAPSDFGWHAYGWAWEAMEHLHEQGLSIDAITVGDELDRMDRLGTFTSDQGVMMTGRAALAQIRADGNPKAIETYAANVLDYAGKRELNRLASEMANHAQNGRRAAEIRDDVIQKLSQLRTFDGRSAKHTQKLAEAVSDAYNHTDQAAMGSIAYIQTGYIDLDKILCGVSAPDLLIVAGRPGQGKTALLVSLAKNIASSKKRVAFFSLEMNNKQIAMRLIAQDAGVSYDKQKTGKLEDADWSKYTNSIDALSDSESYPIYLNDMPSIRPSQIRRELMRIGDVDLAMVDYVGLADADGRYETRALEVASITKALKSICKEFDIPIIAAAQLSRAVEMRSSKRPILSDLKESGGLEENADIVMFIYRPDQYEDNAQKNTAEIIVAKHRNGKVGTAELIYLPERTRFENAAAKSFRLGERNEK